ncbi:hypothetical protein PAXRUDRAFT_685114 [Paxillus rubicundulus Ve08.2h10]|uniref:Uncharacterized protein n=1 Tax=Paxillus rubicundulus Ve08.2h10 TaxID=930991 RepID=A0A0D0E318_9AGAM|nr:hypothetical protein PAXRUDRAFT_685114 [Paxillus rubicundulus Ve08.2h10]
MFSTFSSFLPSALQINQDQRLPPTPPSPETVNAAHLPDPEQCPPVPVETVTSKKKDKKDKHPSESFIVVRPPPSKSNHPLNLQVQLVPPQSRNDRPSTIVQALDTTTTQDDTVNSSGSIDLQRTASNRSDASMQSGYTSVASVSSIASSSTTSSGRRPIIPLYNLQAHNVMANTIVDAGTDAKVAKFTRRGLEVIGLAVFEPIEVWCSAPLPGVLPPTGSVRTSCDDGQREFGLSPRLQIRSPRSRPATPDRPSTSHSVVNGAREASHKPSINLIPASSDLSPPDAPPQRGAKKLFTRIFRKKDPLRPLSIAVPQAGDHTSPANPLRAPAAAAHQSQDVPLSGSLQPDTPQLGDGLASASLTNNVTTLCPAVLGTQAALYPPITPPKGRPTKYVWVVRKWLKGTDARLLNGMMGRLSANGRSEAKVPGALQVEVRFEWSRERKKERKRKEGVERTLSASGTGGNRSVSYRGSAVTPDHYPPATVNRVPSQLLTPSARDAIAGNNRLSTVSQHSTSSDTATSLDSSAAHTRAAEDSGDESDPEDSETPWACAITVQRLGASPLQRQGESGAQREHAIRLKVATLAPTPHHPKVVGMLKMPFPLPDIEVERLAVRRRIVTAQGDTVSSTALWLVVREAFGGVGRERRKGDGWRIRA